MKAVRLTQEERINRLERRCAVDLGIFQRKAAQQEENVEEVTENYLKRRGIPKFKIH